MIPSTGYLRIGPDGRAEVNASLYPSAGSYIRCHSYESEPPILRLDDGPVSVLITTPSRDAVTAGDLATARRLAEVVAAYITGLEQRMEAQDKEAAGSAA